MDRKAKASTGTGLIENHIMHILYLEKTLTKPDAFIYSSCLDHQIYGYRMSLWAEHLGRIEECFKEPEALTCVRKVNEVAEENWKSYTAEKFTQLQGHLLKYPIHVGADGKVGPLAEYENFPDVGGRILGNHAPTIPDVLTT